MLNYPLIEVCIDKIEKKYNKVFTNYSELSDLIRTELQENISEEDILEYYEKYYCTEVEDVKIHFKQLNLF